MRYKNIYTADDRHPNAYANLLHIVYPWNACRICYLVTSNSKFFADPVDHTRIVTPLTSELGYYNNYNSKTTGECIPDSTMPVLEYAALFLLVELATLEINHCPGDYDMPFRKLFPSYPPTPHVPLTL